MVSKNQKKLIKSLYQKKYRKQHGLFVAEGKKMVVELLEAKIEPYALYTIDEQGFGFPQKQLHIVAADELKQISFLTTPQSVLGVFYIPKVQKEVSKGLILALDGIRDPGNLGTIIRLCDWFGISDLVCSDDTVDCYNPKVIQATMGSITRVNIHYKNLADFLERQSSSCTVYGTFMNGNSIYTEKIPDQAVLIMGNEANGISETIKRFVEKQVAIPRFGSSQKTESLNVATATAIFLNEFRRNTE